MRRRVEKSGVILFVGPPGSGKGTQGPLLAKKLGIPYVETGAVLRAVREQQEKMIREGTADIGDRVRLATYMDHGLLVPDELVVNAIKSYVPSGSSFILDGMPRKMTQTELLKELGLKVCAVVELRAPSGVLFKRLKGRFTCRKCNAVYNKSQGFTKDSKCVKCGGEVYQRKDQADAAIKTRLKTYEKETKPVPSHYASKGVPLIRVSAVGDPEYIHKLISKLLVSRAFSKPALKPLPGKLDPCRFKFRKLVRK